MASSAAKKRRQEEVEEEMHLAFRGAANALSQVYTQAVAYQKASYLAGERRAMEHVHGWLSSQQEQALEVPISDVLAFLQNEIAHRTDDLAAPPQHPSLQSLHNFPSAIVQSNPFSFGNVSAALNARIGETNPLRTNFQSNLLIQSSGYSPIRSFPYGNGVQDNHSPRNQEVMQYNSYEPSMAMHHDGL